MNSLTTLWNNSTVPLLVKSSNNFYVLVESKASGDWFIGKPINEVSSYAFTGYILDNRQIVLSGSEAIWSLV